MRVGLPLMLVISLTLHGGVATGIALSQLHIVKSAPASLEIPSTTLTLLSSEEAPDRLSSKPASAPAVSHQVAASTPANLPSSPQPVVEKPSAAPPTPPPPSLALETNPNAHLRALPPEAVLCPSPAPHLDSHGGVVFILDVSGSMYEPYAGTTRLAAAREIMAEQIRTLKDGTPFAITVYAQTARNSGPLVAASNATREAAVRFIMADYDCGGGTDLPAGLTSAMQLGTGQLILVSDGDLNCSMADLMGESRKILGAEGHCPALTILAVSPRPNTADGSLLQALASQQGGIYRAKKVEEMTALLTPGKTTAR